MKPLLSVIMPNYNDAKTLPEALEAILGQGISEIEIIVIDDGSTDNSVEIIQRYPEVTLCRNQRNLGIVSAANCGLKQARGEFLYFASANDKVYLHFFEKSLSHLCRNPAIALSFADFDYFSEKNSTSIRLVKGAHSPVICGGRESEQFFLKTGLWIPPQTAVVRRSHFEELGRFREEFGPYSDWYVWHYLALKYGCVYLPECLGGNRLHENAYCRSARREPAHAVLKALENDPAVLESFRRARILGPILKPLTLSMLGKPHYWRDVIGAVVQRLKRN